MPLTHYIVAPAHARIGVWHISEDEAFFLRKLPLSEAEQAELAAIKGRRRVEWLAGKHLLQVMTGWAFSVVKDAYGKPHLRESNYHISLSHSRDMTAVIIAPVNVGIDIEWMTPRLERIAWRVMNVDKLKNLDARTQTEQLHVYWGAKEAMYKAWGKKELHFKDNLPVQPFDFEKVLTIDSALHPVTEGAVVKGEHTYRFDIFYKNLDNYALVYAIEKHV